MLAWAAAKSMKGVWRGKYLSVSTDGYVVSARIAEEAASMSTGSDAASARIVMAIYGTSICQTTLL